MALRTQASLEKLFAASRLRQQRLKEQETKKYRKAQESVKKELALQQSKKQEKDAQKDWKQHPDEFYKLMNIYRTKFVERFIDDMDVYQTREEIIQAEQRGEGRINWNFFDYLVKQTKDLLFGEKK